MQIQVQDIKCGMVICERAGPWVIRAMALEDARIDAEKSTCKVRVLQNTSSEWGAQPEQEIELMESKRGGYSLGLWIDEEGDVT